jgi:hypothetical protein
MPKISELPISKIDTMAVIIPDYDFAAKKCYTVDDFLKELPLKLLLDEIERRCGEYNDG